MLFVFYFKNVCSYLPLLPTLLFAFCFLQVYSAVIFVISWVECSDLWCLNFLLFSNIGIFFLMQIYPSICGCMCTIQVLIYSYNIYQINIYRCIPYHLICNSFKIIISIIVSSLTYELFIITHLSLQMCRDSVLFFYFCFIALWSENIL